MKIIIALILLTNTAFAQSKTIYPAEIIGADELDPLLDAIDKPLIRCECATNSEDGVVIVSLESAPMDEMREACKEHERNFYMAKKSNGQVEGLVELLTCKSNIGTSSYLNKPISVGSSRTGVSVDYSGQINDLAQQIDELRGMLNNRNTQTNYTPQSFPNYTPSTPINRTPTSNPSQTWVDSKGRVRDRGDTAPHK
jgi:hypothetical protein